VLGGGGGCAGANDMLTALPVAVPTGETDAAVVPMRDPTLAWRCTLTGTGVAALRTMVGDTHRVLVQLVCLTTRGVCERATAAACRPLESAGLALRRTVVLLMKRVGPCAAVLANDCEGTGCAGMPNVANELHICICRNAVRLATELGGAGEAAGITVGAAIWAGQTQLMVGPLVKRIGGEGDR